MQRDGAGYNPVRLAAVFMIVTGLFGIILRGWPLHFSDHYALHGETVALCLAVC